MIFKGFLYSLFFFLKKKSKRIDRAISCMGATATRQVHKQSKLCISALSSILQRNGESPDFYRRKIAQELLIHSHSFTSLPRLCCFISFRYYLASFSSTYSYKKTPHPQDLSGPRLPSFTLHAAPMHTAPQPPYANYREKTWCTSKEKRSVTEKYTQLRNCPEYGLT